MSTAAFLAGFVMAEGCFTKTGEPPRFRFAVALGAQDAGMCHTFHCFLAVGHVHLATRRKPHYDDEVVFAVGRARDLVQAVVPFMDDHLPQSSKRQQYEAWREELLRHWAIAARRPRPCAVDGCLEPRRAHGVCRRHLYELHGR